MSSYLHFKGKTMSGTSLEKWARKEAEVAWLCTGCGRPKPGIDKVSVHIQEECPERPLNLVDGVIALAHRPFLMRFGEERVAKYLNLGEVYGPSGNLLPDWVTFIGRHRLIVRGSRHVSSRICPECGRRGYFAMGKNYLCPQPPEEIELFESDLWGLIVPEHIAKTLGISEDDGVWMERLEVLATPLDGLPPLLD